MIIIVTITIAIIIIIIIILSSFFGIFSIQRAY